VIRRFWWLPVVIGLILRLIYLYTFARHLFFNTFSDAQVYHLWAMRIVKHCPPPPPFFMSPLYPYFVSLIYFLSGPSITTVLFIQALLDTATTFFIFQLGKLVWGRRVGFFAAMAYAILPSAIFYSGLFLMPSLLTFLITLASYLLLSGGGDLLAGLLLGIAVLGRGNILIPALLPLRFFKARSYPIGLLIPIGTLFLINLTIGKAPIITTYNFGLNFYIGNNPDADGTYHRPGGLDLTEDRDGRKVIELISGKGVDCSGSSRFWTGRAFSFIIGHPIKTLWLVVKKIYFFIGPIEIPQFENLYYVLDRTLLRFLPLRFWLLIPFFISAFFLPKKGTVSFLLWFVLLYGAALIPFFIIGRFRQPIVPLITVVAVGTLFTIGNRRDWRIITLVVALLLSYTFINLISQAGIRRAIFNTRSDYGIWAYYAIGPDVGFDSTRVLLKEDPDNVKCLVNLGNYYFRRSEYYRARFLYRRAVAVDPDDGEANANLGITFLALGKIDSALTYLERAKEILPYSILVRRTIARVKKIKSKGLTPIGSPIK